MAEQKFTNSLINTFQRASQLAEAENCTTVSDLHMMGAALEDKSNPLASFLSVMGVNTAELAMKVRAELDKLPKTGNSSQGGLEPDAQLNSHLARAATLTTKFNDKFASLELYLLAVVEDNNHNNTLGKVLKSLPNGEDFNAKKITDTIAFLRQGRTVDSADDNALDDEVKAFVTDLTERAEQGKIDPVIGRSHEIERCLQILQRRSKNNPVLIGKPGVGKTAVVEGLAQKIVKGDVPDSLKNVRIYSLDLGALMSGTQYRGQFEQKMKKLIDSLIKSQGDSVLFIDEIHQIVGAGNTEGSMDIANLLKPALSRGEIHCMGATTLDEYRKYIEKDSALERRFQKVIIDEPTVEDTIQILRGLKEKYSIHHKVQISDSAIIAAAVLSNRYITDRMLPDKAIDLVDEAASKIAMEISSLPTSMVNLRNQIDELKIAKFTLEKEAKEDPEVKARLEKILANLEEKEQEYASLDEVLQSEKEHLNAEQNLKAKLDDLRFQSEKALQNGDYEAVSRLNYKEIPELQEKIKNLATEDKEYTLIRTRVTEKEIAEIISQITGIPLTKLQETERQKLLDLEKVLGEHVIGQPEAISVVSNAVRRSRAQIQDDRKPIGSFLFLGTTGVGKTELARALAYQLFDNEDAIIRIDMSEYMEKHSVSRLIGAAPGYIGYDQGGQLTEAVRRAPYSIVLFDEIEKAHPDVFNIFLQILDNGQLTDSQGRIVNFRNTVVIMTSNLGSREILEHPEYDYDQLRAMELDILKHSIRPEVLNRIDDIVVFHPLEKSAMEKIAMIQINRLNQRLKFQERELVIEPSALEFLCNEGYDREFGARPLKRVITNRIENPLSRLIISGESPVKSIIRVEANPAYRDEDITPNVQPLEFRVLPLIDKEPVNEYNLVEQAN